jgi:hypothetical protein
MGEGAVASNGKKAPAAPKGRAKAKAG